MGRRLTRAANVAAFAMLVLGSSHAAHAQTSSSDQVAAQALYDDAKALMGQKKFADACKKLEESQRLDPGVGTHYALADCYEQEGKIATAWVAFLDVASESSAQSRADRATEAKRRAGLLAPRLSKVTIHVPQASRVDGLAVKRDAEIVRDAQWEVDVPVDPGTHAITATAPGKLAWQTTLTVDVESKTFPVTVPLLQNDPSAQAPAGVTVPPSTPLTPSTAGPAGDEPARGLGTQRKVALVVGGVGVAGLVLGGVFGIMALSKHSDAQTSCNGAVCNASGLADTQDGQTDGNVSTIAMGVGGAAVVGAVVLWLTAPRAKTHAAAFHAAPLVGHNAGGITVGGAW